MLAEWILEELQAIRAPNKTTPEDVQNMIERWEKEETAMKITLSLQDWEIQRLAKALEDPNGDIYDWSDPRDVEQGIKDLISDYI